MQPARARGKTMATKAQTKPAPSRKPAAKKKPSAPKRSVSVRAKSAPRDKTFREPSNIAKVDVFTEQHQAMGVSFLDIHEYANERIDNGSIEIALNDDYASLYTPIADAVSVSRSVTIDGKKGYMYGVHLYKKCISEGHTFYVQMFFESSTVENLVYLFIEHDEVMAWKARKNEQHQAS